MAKVKEKRTSSYTKRLDERQAAPQMDYQMVTEGNVVRKKEPEPRRNLSTPSTTVQKNREREKRMDRAYVLVLSMAAVCAVFFTVRYLELKSDVTSNQKKVISLSTKLSALKLENDTVYNQIVSSVNLDEVKEIAMNELGMTYVLPSQIVLYDSAENDYVKQYQDIPAQ